MKERLAVIDLGTNTFHILIVEADEDTRFKEVLRIRRYIKLAEEGIEKIGNAPYQRGIEALSDFSKLLQEEKVKKLKAFGTAALRTASNGKQFIQDAYEKTGIAVEIISGDLEAQLIYQGVKQAVPKSPEHMLIMDIGGGSVEFIIADHQQIYWAQSFPIGVAVLYKNFHRNNPISEAEIKSIEDFILNHISPLIEVLKTHPCQILAGASGTFDVLESILVEEKSSPIYSNFKSELFHPLYEQLIVTSLEDREAMESIPASRVDMIIVAMILINVVLRLSPVEQIAVSAYAMKEGILAQMLKED